MKNILLVGLLLITSLSLQAQNSSGEVYFIRKTISKPIIINTTDELQNKINLNESLKDGRYILSFNNEYSLYDKEEKKYLLDRINTFSYYKNQQTNLLLKEVFLNSSQYLVEDSIPKRTWKIKRKSKSICGYKVFKAKTTTKIPVKNKFKNTTITAWFTPQIPVSNGPEEYGGLPGLILELHVNGTTTSCNKVILKPEKEIIPPKKGKIISKKEFNQLLAESIQ